MKKIIVLFSLFGCLASFFSCSTKVDLYADYKDVPIVFGIINHKADTNYIKITKAFCGSNDNPINANEVALISDSSNYQEKLEVYIVESQSTSGQAYQWTGRKFEFDTITIHNKEDGTFYSPDQTLYYTTERFHTNSNSDKYKYRLFILKPNGDTLKAETVPVGGNVEILSAGASFQSSQSDAVQKLFFRSSEEAILYDIKMQFNYEEEHPGQARTQKNVSWSYGARTLSEYERMGDFTDAYSLNYSVNTLFNALSNKIGGDTIWDVNHPNVTRYIGDFIVSMTVAGRELYEIYEMSNVMENGYTNTNYSNIKGGYGLFSSRTIVSKKLKFNSTTKRDIFRMPWGFVEE